ncbi:MAG: mechanosensitive ion channel [Syntrophorhabdaceae bacterium]|nr:mechanosensitive ion channel [Syntrophorhabdaceae bacterium]HOC45295.1 mechanosensitive ion channel [Syntrophorhabdaceae bacterium]
MRKSAVAVLFLAVVIVLAAFSTFARTGGPPEATRAGRTAESTPAAYPVVLGDKTLFLIKEVKGVSVSAKARAEMTSERLKELAENFNMPVDSITTMDYKSPSILISAGHKQLLAVLNEDARAEGRDRLELTKERVQLMQDGIREYRKKYGMKSIVLGCIFVLAATMVLIAIFIFLNRVYRRLQEKIDGWVESKKILVSITKFDILRAERLRMVITTLIKVTRLAAFLFFFYVYVHSSLSFLPWTREFADQIFGYIAGPLKTAGLAVLREFPDVVIIIVIIVVTRYALKIVHQLFDQIGTGTIEIKDFYPDWADPTYKICRLLILVSAAVMAYPYIPGSSSLAFKGISVFLGALISIGSSSAVANVIAGYTLIYRRVFRIGDRVKIGDFVGDVVEMRLQVVHLKTVKNEEIVVPSSMIVSSPVVNYSFLAKERGLILHTTVTIGYDTPWRQVEALLLIAAEKTTGLLRQPPPFILQTSLDDFYVSYELNAYTDRPDIMAEIYAELHRNIQDIFNEYDVQIMSPSYRADPAEPKVVPKERWYAPPARKLGDENTEEAADTGTRV